MEACERYCKEHGLRLATEAEYSFFDEGRSAYTGDHVSEKGQLARFLRMVEEGKIERDSYLLVESLDRLSRELVRIAPRWSAKFPHLWSPQTPPPEWALQVM